MSAKQLNSRYIVIKVSCPYRAYQILDTYYNFVYPNKFKKLKTAKSRLLQIRERRYYGT